MSTALLWVPATLIASMGQVARNAMQRRLVHEIGTAGATQVRFLYGFPFALIFLALALGWEGGGLPCPGPGFWGFLFLGSLSQVMATATMLSAMRERSFAVVTALIKTEAVQIAVFGFVVLGDRLTAFGAGGVILATLGVVLMSWSPKVSGEISHGAMRSVVLGILAGGLFALSAVGFRGAILALDRGDFLIRATTALALSLALQTAILLVWMVLFDRGALMGSLRVWRSSLLAGCLGASASQFWFFGFALTAAANVRTLALVEILFAQLVSRRFMAQSTSGRELAGMGLIAIGVVSVLWAAL